MCSIKLTLVLKILVLLTLKTIDLVVSEDTEMSAKIVCYYSAWAVYRDQPMDYDIEDIPAEMCTHLIYSFIGLDNKTYELKMIGPSYDLEKKGFERFVGLRNKHPQLKLMLAIGLHSLRLFLVCQWHSVLM